jgi:hypothetical protein
MANKIVVNTGKLWLGSLAIAAGHPKLDTNVKIHLFSNNLTIIRTTVLGDLTEIAYPGYASITLSGAVDGGIDANNWDTWAWPTATFQATSAPGSPVTAYGYYVTDSGGTTLLWAENFATPQVFTLSGDGFTLPPTFSFGSLFSN